MEPIISPWLIYLLGVISEVRAVLIIIFVLLAIGFLVKYIIKGMSYLEDDEGLEKMSKSIKCPKSLLICFLILCIIVPSKETLIGMLVAKQITPHNITSAVTAGKDFKNEVKKDVLDIIMAITNKKEEKTRGAK